MFGKEYSNYPEILLNQMFHNSSAKLTINPILKPFIKAYIDFFGIPHIGLQVRALYFRKFMKHFDFRSILDAGCGLGFYSFYLAKKSPLKRIDACDHNPKVIEIDKKIRDRLHYKNLHFFQKDLLDLSESNEYDLIYCIDVLEHIKEDEQVVENIFKALRKDGIFYLHVPQKKAKVHLQRFDDCARVRNAGHVRRGYSKEKLIQLMEKKGFKIRKVVDTFGWFASLAWELNQISLSVLPIAALIFLMLLAISSVETLTFSASSTAKKPWSSEILIISQKFSKE